MNLFNIIASSYQTTAPADRIIQDGLYVEYDPASPLCYPGSGTTLFDKKGNVDMILYGDMQNGYNPNGFFTMDGINDYGQTPTFNIDWTSNTDGHTLGIWVEFDSLSIVDFTAQLYYSNFGGMYIYSSGAGDRIRFRYLGGSNGYISDYTGAQNNKWYYLVITHRYINPTTARISGYVGDGTAVTDEQYNFEFDAIYPDATGLLRISHPTYELAGSVGEYHYYTKQLTKAEVDQNYNQTKARYGY